MAAFATTACRNFSKPTHIVIGPGGSKGFYFIGALHELYVSDMLTDVVGYSGSSVGAMLSLLMTCGYKPSQINRMAVETNLFADFFTVKLGQRIDEMRKNCGVISNTAIRVKLEEAVIRKFGKMVTMKELYERTHILFQAVTFDIQTNTAYYINHINFPDLNVIQAVLFSINIPLLFYRLIYGAHEFIDGAFCDPLPIFPFDDGKNKVLTLFINTEMPPPPVGSLIPGVSYGIHKMLTTGIHQYRDTIMAFASNKCDFIELTSSIIDTTGATLGDKEKVKMFMDGTRIIKYYMSLESVEDEDTPDPGMNSIKFQLIRNFHKNRPIILPSENFEHI